VLWHISVNLLIDDTTASSVSCITSRPICMFCTVCDKYMLQSCFSAMDLFYCILTYGNLKYNKISTYKYYIIWAWYVLFQFVLLSYKCTPLSTPKYSKYIQHSGFNNSPFSMNSSNKNTQTRTYICFHRLFLLLSWCSIGYFHISLF